MPQTIVARAFLNRVLTYNYRRSNVKIGTGLLRCLKLSLMRSLDDQSLKIKNLNPSPFQMSRNNYSRIPAPEFQAEKDNRVAGGIQNGHSAL